MRFQTRTIVSCRAGFREFRPQLSTWLAVLALVAAMWGTAARAVTLVQEFYLPMPEQQLYTALNTIQSGISTTQSSIFSIVITGDGTVVYYDQAEDGYEPDLSNPTNSSTQIWGDGNDAHGIPPGFAHNPAGGLPAGTVITLTNNVPLPRNASVKLFDGGDRIASTKAIVISRAGWPVTPGPVFGGAVSVLSTMDYGTNYISPVGQDLTNNLFKYVGMFVMASQPGTTVTIDTNGTGVGTTTIVLNQGESYLVNGGVKKGGRITASKPVQAHLMIGHVNGGYAADWFTLYPVQSWSSAYYTPVGSATNGTQPAYVYLYNPNPTNITVNYNTLGGAGSFVVPATNGVYQFQMPKGSGGSFVSGGSPFYALCTVAANPANDTAYNWGFTLLPSGGLTTAATVGWAPGSSDGTVDGSPVWVTPLQATRIYVDYKGDHAGPLTDPLGNKYDTNYDLVALQSQRIYDPSKNQTGMRVYTLDGTLITAAWGEDPDVAAPGNPYIDAGTTVLPFPVPILKKSSTLISNTPPTLLYTVELDNKGLLPLGNTVVIDLPTTNLSYVTNTTTYNGSPIPDGTSGTAFPLAAPGYTIPVILSQGTSTFTYKCLIVGSGIISNSVNVGGTSISAQNVVPTGTNTSTINFTDSGGTTVPSYAAGTNVFITLTDAGANTSSNTVQTLSVVVRDATNGDFETLTLTETGTNTGVFRNLTGLPTSLSAGVVQQDGTLHVAAGDLLTVNYTDAAYGNSCSASATIQTPALYKVLYLTANGTNGVQALDRVNPAATTGHGTTYSSIDLNGGGSSGVVVFDAASSNNASGTVTWTHITTNAANRLMLVGTEFIAGSGNASTAITYGGVALTKVKSITNSSALSEIWELVNPPPGTNTISITKIGSARFYAGAATFSGVATNTPLSATNTATGTASPSSVTIASTNGEIVFDNLASDNLKPVVGSGQTQLWVVSNGNAEGGGASRKPGTNSVTMTWTAGNPWADIAVSVKAAPASGGGGGTNTTTFTQTPFFCQPFTMPSNSLVTITNFITVTNGSMPTNPAITATLAIGTTNLVTFTNAAYTSSNSNLVWTGTLTTNVTVPSGAALSYIITNNQSGTSFHIDYDSTNKVSKIAVPAGNVIHITGFGVYDAPYPNGSLVSTPAAGTVIYVRVSVIDPFGSADITSLGLNIAAPSSSANLVTNLTATVSNDGCTKVFEYVWQTGPVTGSYSLSATANEGTEGIFDTAATSLSLIFLDLGTPSKTEFTAGSNGSATNAYGANAIASFRITDLNRNTDPTTAESITAILTSGAGGSNLVTLVETGTNTGIFTNSILTSTNGSGGFLAPVGTILTLSYTDPGDSSDHTTATATILPLPGIAGIAVSKTLVTPANGKAIAGDAVQFNLQVVNTGSTVLTNVTLTDTFPSAMLTFSTASLAPTATTATQLTWTNLGPLGTGQSTNVTVNFTAAGSGNATNSANVSSGGAAGNGAAVVTITHPALTVIKTLLSPTNSPVSITSNVVFRIVVTNGGDTAIPTLPLEDAFSAAYLQFVTATIAPDGNGAGSLLWLNLAATNSLAPGASITNDVTMKVVGAGSPALNTATVDFAVDANGKPVPTSVSVNTNLVTAAASINGHVYNDINHTGVFTNGDTGLGGVPLALYTDPNGDGNPADGSLVALTTSDANGYYEFLNLPPGHYVVVETDLAGYVSSAPANGRLPLNLVSLAASAGNNFFDYQPSANVYATVSGRVWNDTNANNSVDAGESGLANVNVDLVQDVNSNGLADAGEPVVASATTDTNGNYSFIDVTPGYYVIRETVPYGYYSSGNSIGSGPAAASQIGLNVTNGLVTTNNVFFDRLPPTGVNDTASAANNVPVIINPLTNDISPNGDKLFVTNAVSTNGPVVINTGNTNLTFTPTNLGTAYITYTLSDGHGGTSTALITVTVTNLPPVANPDTASTPKNVQVTVPVLANDTDPNGDTLTLVSVNTTNGLANVSGTNAVYTPSTNFIGTAVLTYTITDGNGGTNSSTITVSVTNRPPTAVNDTATAARNVAVVISPLVNDTDPDNDPLIITNAVSTNGVVVINAGNTNLTFTPTNLGSAYITYTITDGFGGSSSALITVTVTNLPPVANPDTASTPKNVQVTVPVLANDTDPNGDTLTLVSVNTTNGLANVSGTNVVYTPSTNFIGTAVLTYTITDGNGGTNSSTITVSVTNRPPTAVNDTASAANNVPVVINPLVNDTDPDNDPLIITNAVSTNGVVVINAGNTNLTFTPTNLGSAYITYAITDGFGGSSSALITVTVTNTPPVANPDTASTPKNVQVTVPVLANDTDPNGDTLTLVGVNTTNGVANVSGTNVVYTPSTNFVGTNVLTYTITDGNGGTNSSTITVSVTNRPPTAVNDVATGANNIAQIINPLVNDTDPDNDPLIITNAVSTNGMVTINAGNTNLTFTPTNLGSAYITYTITDGFGGSSSALITVTVTNTPPVANPDTASTPKNVQVTVPVLANDTDPNGDTLTLVSVNTTNGVANVSGTNAVYTPSTNFIGTAVLTYTITDGNGGTNSSTLTVSVTNRPPTAVNDIATGANNIAQIINPLVNDTDPDNDPLIITNAVSTNGVVTINAGNTNLTFTPTNLGSAYINYTITDGFGGSSSALITVTVTNTPPVANPDTTNTPVNVPVTINPLINDTDPNGDVLSLVPGSLVPANGTASIVNGTNVLFTPQTNFNGTATIGYSITDGNGGTNSSVITVTVTPVTDLMVLLDGPTNVYAGTNFTYTVIVTNLGPSTASNLVLTDSLPADVTFVSVSGGGSTNGSPVVWTNLGTLPANTSTTLTIIVTSPLNADILTNLATVTSNPSGTNPVMVTGLPLVTTVTPVADVGLGLTAPAGVLPGASFNYTVWVTNFGPSTASSVMVTDSVPANVTLVGAGSGGDTNTSGLVVWGGFDLPANTTTSFQFTVTAPVKGGMVDGVLALAQTLDLNLSNNIAALTVVVSNLPPVANPDTATTPKGVTVTVPVLVNDTDPNGDPLTLVGVITTNGLANVSGTNVVYTPPTNFVGTAVLVYTITDGNGGTNSSTITVGVTNRPPVANPDTASTPKNVAVSIDPRVNDTDPDNDPLIIVSVATTNGTAITRGGTNVLYTPSTNFIGTAVLTYVITDGFGGTNSSTITVSVTNRPPTAVNDMAAGANNLAMVINPLVNDTDPDHDPLSITSAVSTNGTVVINLGNTNLTFTPTNLGPAYINYSIADGFGGTGSALITVTVTNTPPVANPDTASTPKNVAVTVPVLANDTDPNGDTLTLVGVNTTNGLAGVSGTNVVYTPSTNFVGTNVLTYTITDGNGGTNSSTITVSVTNRPPVANPDTASTPKNMAVAIDPRVNDTDPDNDPLTIAGVTTTNGTAVNRGGTNVLYTPSTNFIGTVVLTYKITDGFGGTNSSTITVSVTNRPPVANPDTTNTAKNVAVTIKPLVNDTDPDNDPLTIVAGSLTPSSGTASIVSGTNVLFLPATNFTGTATIGYSITDGYGGTNSSTITVSVTGTVTPSADIAVFLYGPTNNLTEGNGINYTNVVVNYGPYTATNVVLMNTLLPTNVVFVSASAGGVYSSTTHTVTWPKVPTLANGASTNFTLIVTITNTLVTSLTVTNIASATNSTFDPNPTNNTGVLDVSRSLAQIYPEGLPVLPVSMTAVFNPQISMYEEHVTVTNNGATTVTGMQLYPVGLRAGKEFLEYASGTNGGQAYVQFNGPLLPGNSVSFQLEVLSVDNITPTNTFRIVPAVAATAGTNTGTAIQITRIFYETVGGTVDPVIEFTATVGRVYGVAYSDDSGTTWSVATPYITATSTDIQWVDAGPPMTAPLTSSIRLYRVLLWP